MEPQMDTDKHRMAESKELRAKSKKNAML